MTADAGQDRTLDVRPWRSSDGDTRCQNCGQANVTWFTENYLWNRVVGTEENPRGEGVILCPLCFVRAAERAGVGRSAWWLGDSPLLARVKREAAAEARLPIRRFAEASAVTAKALGQNDRTALDLLILLDREEARDA